MTVRPAAILDRPLRLALAGCGRISANHFAAIREHAGRVELAGVCDVDPAALAKATAATGAPGFADYGAMLAALSRPDAAGRRGADLVVLATPSGLHPSQAIDAARAGLHVMTEKPMATRWADGLAMVRACDDAGVRLFVVKQNRTNRTLQLLKRARDAGRFGRIFMVVVNVLWSRPQAYYDSAAWRGTWEFDGGAFMNQASHYVDLLDWLVGPVESVTATTGTLARDIEVEDTGSAVLKWRNGAIGSINVTMLAEPRNFEGSITIVAEKGTVRVGGVAVNAIEHWKFAEPHPMDDEVDAASYATDSVYGPGHPRYYDNAIRALRGEAPAETDGREGLKSLELLIAMYRSARDGRRVNLPLEY